MMIPNNFTYVLSESLSIYLIQQGQQLVNLNYTINSFRADWMEIRLNLSNFESNISHNMVSCIELDTYRNGIKHWIER